MIKRPHHIDSTLPDRFSGNPEWQNEQEVSPEKESWIAATIGASIIPHRLKEPLKKVLHVLSNKVGGPHLTTLF